MVIQRAMHLGYLHQVLGIEPASRVSFEFTKNGLVVWDLRTGIRHLIDMSKGPSVTRDRFDVPPMVQRILEASDAELKQQWADGEGWDDEREAIFSEMSARGISALPSDTVPRRVKEKQLDENTPESKAYMRQNWPMILELIKSKGFQDQLAIQGKAINWDAINATEREIGLPESQRPDDE